MNMEIIPCTKATFLMSKREEHALSLAETFHLYLHLLVCEFCRRFLKQTGIIAKEMKRMTSGETLTAEEKQKMKELLHLAS
jgi:hypothetical protein